VEGKSDVGYDSVGISHPSMMGLGEQMSKVVVAMAHCVLVSLGALPKAIQPKVEDRPGHRPGQERISMRQAT
jgi:hypothetical protein